VTWVQPFRLWFQWRLLWTWYCTVRFCKSRELFVQLHNFRRLNEDVLWSQSSH